MTNTIGYLHYYSIGVLVAVEEEKKEPLSQHANNHRTDGDGTKLHPVHKLKNYLFSRRKLVALISLIVIAAIMPLSILLLMQGIRFIGRAQGTNAAEPETGSLSGNVSIGSDVTASGGQFVHFGVGGTPVMFQPSAPYHATFYYMWYKNLATDGSWNGSYWNDLGNNPPTTWFSHYIPDQDGNSATFDPASQLYSSNDYNNFKWQATKLAEAKQEVAIGSWWGQGGKEDSAFNTILNTFMGNADNPYPNLRWSLYYECEGSASTVCGGTSNPTVAKIVSDLQYFQLHYTSSPYFLKVGGKPVIFVYADAADSGTTDTTCSDSSMVSRWKQANTQLGNAFYIVLKVFSGYATSACQPDSWHQYAPATRSGSHSTYDFYVSPGFWKDDGSAVTLARDATAFENAVKSMVAYNATWKITETWNEWGEGSSVEPGFQTIVNGGVETIDPVGTPFGNLYIDILNRNLPALEQGTGSNPQPTPTPSASTVTYYVDCTLGNDANLGTDTTQAWQSLAKASSALLNPGDKLLFKRGCVWSGSLALSRSGSTTQNIFIGAYGTGALPTIQNSTDNSATVSISGSYLTIDSLYAQALAPAIDPGCQNNPKGHVEGFAFQSGAANNTLQTSKATGAYAGVFLKEGSHDNHVLNNTLQDNIMMFPLDTTGGNDAGAFAVLIWGTNNEIANNTMTGSNACSYDYGRDGSAVEVYNGSGNSIHHNIGSDDDAFAELGKDSSHTSADNTFAYNKFTSALTNSLFLNTRGVGNSFGPVYRTKAYNNSVYVTGSSSQGVVCSDCGTDILTLKNNILWADWKAAYASAAFDESNNIYWKTGGSPLIQGFTVSSTSKIVDPQYVNTSTSDLHLQSTSQALNAGTSESVTAGFTKDLDNNAVPNPAGSNPDIGAYEQ